MRYINQSRRSDQTPTRGLTLSKAKSFSVKTTKFFLSFDRVRPRKQKSEKVASTGDTIIEVMMSLVILSMILATVYAMGTRSLRAGTESNQRTEALSIAQSQIDLLVNAKNIDPIFDQNFQTDQAYCLKPDGTKDASAQSNVNKLCNSYSGSQYSIGVSYNSNVFTVTAQWPSADAPNGTANLNLYYKLSGVYKKAKVTAGSGSAVGTNSTIDGTVTPNGNSVTDCYFNYDTSTSYSQAKKVPCTALPAGSGTTPITVRATISGLDTNTKYWFQLCATNIVGTACSDNNGTFTTTGPPVIKNQSADNTETASGNIADLKALVNPVGTDVTDCYFEWGTTTSYSSGSKKCNENGRIGSGNDYVQVTAHIASLNEGVTYHFRTVATNAVGTTRGEPGVDPTFTTRRPKLTATLTANPTSVAYNAPSNLTWTSNATDCTASSRFSTGGQPNGNASTGNLTTTTDFTVTCTRGNESVTSSPARVTVGPPPPTIDSLSALAPPSNRYGFSISNGQSIYTSTGVSRTLSWTTTGASYCNASGGWGGNNLLANSAQGVTAYPGTNYVLTCYNSGGSISRTFNFSYTNSYFTLWDAAPFWESRSAQNYGENGATGSAYGLPGGASTITFGNGIGTLCADLSRWGVSPPTNTAACGGYYCWTFSGTVFLGEIPFNNGGNWASFNDSVVGGIAGRDCNNN